MHITSIRLRSFRNYPLLDFRPGSGITLIAGKNAQGKTNLLESIFLSSTGRSHRTRKDRELIRWGEREALLRIECAHTYAAHQVQMRFFPASPRQIEINGAPIARSGELMGHINSVLFAPEDLRLIKDGPQERRRFMDMELSQSAPQYFYALQRYAHTLRQRNALLRQLMKKPSLTDALDTWDEQLARAAVPVFTRRVDFADRLRTIAGLNHAHIAGAGEEMQVVYKPNPDGEGYYYDRLLSALQRDREDDIRQGVTSHGPHRDDLQISIAGRDARVYASQGQQRTAALALKLSEITLLHQTTGEWPVLLLDDVMSELDERRRNALLEFIGGVQTFITAASPDFLLPAGVDRCEVSDGTLHFQDAPVSVQNPG